MSQKYSIFSVELMNEYEEGEIGCSWKENPFKVECIIKLNIFWIAHWIESSNDIMLPFNMDNMLRFKLLSLLQINLPNKTTKNKMDGNSILQDVRIIHPMFCLHAG